MYSKMQANSNFGYKKAVNPESKWLITRYIANYTYSLIIWQEISFMSFFGRPPFLHDLKKQPGMITPEIDRYTFRRLN